METTALFTYQRARKRSSKRQTVPLTLWVKPPLKEALSHMAKREGLSISSIGKAGLEDWVHQKLHSQHEALLYPMVRQVIREELRAFGNRIVFFLMRIAFASEQSRILITNILDRILKQEGAPEQTLYNLVDRSSTLAKRNIIKKTPQLQTLLDEWEASFTKERSEGQNTGNA